MAVVVREGFGMSVVVRKGFGMAVVVREGFGMAVVVTEGLPLSDDGKETPYGEKSFLDSMNMLCTILY